MHFILPARDLITNSVETMASINHVDGLVLLGSCDKVIPGLLMAAARLDIPTIIVNGGPAMGGMQFDGRASDNSSMVEALAMLEQGKITQEEYDILENRSNPCKGSCSFLGTANTMCAVTEAMGMCLPGTSMIPAVMAERLRAAQASGRRIVEMVREGLTARKMINSNGIENAVRLGNGNRPVQRIWRYIFRQLHMRQSVILQWTLWIKLQEIRRILQEYIQTVL